MFGNLITQLYLKRLETKGFQHGSNFNLEKGANIDAGFVKHIKVGNNVTLAKDVYILAHDASMKKFIGKTKCGAVILGDNVFVGAYSVILPGITIGSNCIIAACSCVTKDIPDNEVWGGNPAAKLCNTEEFLRKQRERMANSKEKFWFVD